MSVKDWMTIAAALAQVAGYSGADIIRRFRGMGTSEREITIRGITRLLSVFEGNNDPLTGLWALNRWNYTSKAHSQYYVTGKLAVLYRSPKYEVWKGTLLLKYCRELSDKGWLAKKRGRLIEGAYEIEIRKKSESSYTGTSTQIYRNPKIEIMHSGEFSDIHVDEGKLVCEFFNTNTEGHADVVFHQRKRWKEIDVMELM